MCLGCDLLIITILLTDRNLNTSDKNSGTSHEKLSKFIIPLLILIRMRNVSNKICRENQNTFFTFNNLFLPENRSVYEIILTNMVQPNRPQIKYNMMHALCMLDFLGYRHTLRK